MVKNKKQLLEAVSMWLGQAQKDITSKIEDFANEQGISIDEVAEALDIDDDELDELFDGDGNITVETFAKLLIANDLAIAIVPAKKTPGGSYSRGNGYGTRSKRVMTRPEMEEPHAIDPEEEQPRDARGRFMPKSHNGGRGPVPPRGAMPPRGHAMGPNPYLSLSVDALRDIITKNNWGYEIDLANATRDEMIDFMMEKERLLAQGMDRRPMRSEKPSRRSARNESPEASSDEFVDALCEFLKSNPEATSKLAKRIARRR